MIDRRIKGATGNLYDHSSNAHHWALERLSGLLSEVGFEVRAKPAREKTLRVYPTRVSQYPLLNPRFTVMCCTG